MGKREKSRSRYVIIFFCLVMSWAAVSNAELPACSNAIVQLTEDYLYAVGSVDFNDPNGYIALNSDYEWRADGVPVSSGQGLELLFLALDNSVDGSAGESALQAVGIGYGSSKWGWALALDPGGKLSFKRQGNLSLDEGTIEMWIALRYDGDAPVYAGRSHGLFHYRAVNGDYVVINQSPSTGVIYAGGNVNGQWQSAYSGNASTRGWLAG